MIEIEFGIWMGEFNDLGLGQKAVPPTTPDGRKLWLSDDGRRAFSVIAGEYHLYSVKAEDKTLRCTHLGAINDRPDAESFLNGTPIEKIPLSQPASGKIFFPILIKLGPQIVRSWFDTVINPIVRALKVEEKLIREKNWTWQFRPGRLEVIRLFQDYVSSEAQENIEHFLGNFPLIQKDAAIHDDEVTNLFVQCKSLQRALEDSPALKSIYDDITSETSLKELDTSIGDLFGGYPVEEHIDLLAQFIVNNTGELPYYYRVSKLWNRHRTILLGLLDDPFLKSRRSQVERAGDKLGMAGKHLHDSLKNLRDFLASEFDVPIITTAQAFNH